MIVQVHVQFRWKLKKFLFFPFFLFLTYQHNVKLFLKKLDLIMLAYSKHNQLQNFYNLALKKTIKMDSKNLNTDIYTSKISWKYFIFLFKFKHSLQNALNSIQIKIFQLVIFARYRWMQIKIFLSKFCVFNG